MADNDDLVVIRIPAPIPGREQPDLSFLQETFPRSEEERWAPWTQEELDELMELLCPPSLRTPEDV